MPNRAFLQPFFLLVNPPIYDFAAHDLWLKPLGLLYIASILENAGTRVSLIDYLDRNHPLVPKTKSNSYGCGKYYTQETLKPEAYKKIPRIYKRFGLSRQAAIAAFKGLVKPDMILVSSGMTYWYPGVQEAIGCLKEVFPNVPVVLGGAYAALCGQHANENAGADFVISSYGLTELSKLVEDLLKYKIDVPKSFNIFPAPSYRYYHKPGYAVIRTSLGCPYNCSYCAQSALTGGYIQRKPFKNVIEEITGFAACGINNIAFYDDALLFEAERHIVPILQDIIERKISVAFHTPNGLHSRFISPTVAKLLKESGFVSPRISLETADPERQKVTGSKVTNAEFQAASELLKQVGYKSGEYTAYVMLGMPGQDLSEVENAIKLANQCGAKVSVSEYSPIPGTGDWAKIRDTLPSTDPLWHNNSVYSLLGQEDRKKIESVKQLAKNLNRSFT